MLVGEEENRFLEGAIAAPVIFLFSRGSQGLRFEDYSPFRKERPPKRGPVRVCRDSMRGSVRGNQSFASEARLARAAAIVWSISSFVCAAETNSASNCDGGKKIPRRSIS